MIVPSNSKVNKMRNSFQTKINNICIISITKPLRQIPCKSILWPYLVLILLEIYEEDQDEVRLRSESVKS